MDRFHSPLFTRFEPGPALNPAGPVLVSGTELTLHRRRDLVGVARAGIRLRRGWYAMPGAVGLWLWVSPLEGKSGALSVWTGEHDLQRFVGLPAHVEIMRRFRDRGTVRSTTWTADVLDARSTLGGMRRWIDTSPEPVVGKPAH
ncbi:hypothetical protein [Saccharopolyspora sp. ASAGF58]|uniref:hypothetical protein n=1 Tax=Saccharopolyspora sp. ASAGF58 TaxID=2719023 RepID=UPI001B314285|nr:hypothetical protein [Saccharopolyspora sp. ASAGF58]